MLKFIWFTEFTDRYKQLNVQGSYTPLANSFHSNTSVLALLLGI